MNAATCDPAYLSGVRVAEATVCGANSVTHTGLCHASMTASGVGFCVSATEMEQLWPSRTSTRVAVALGSSCVTEAVDRRGASCGARIAAAVAPIGAVIGEWVGASAGLGYLVTLSLARGQTPLAFAALVVLCLLGLALYYATDWAGRVFVPWQSQGA